MHQVRRWLGYALCLFIIATPFSFRLRHEQGTRMPAQAVPISAVAADATPSQAPASPVPVRESPPLSLTLMLIFTGCSVGLVLAVLILGFVAARGNRPKP